MTGPTRWTAVHHSDAARLMRLGSEHAPASSVLHAAGEEGVAMRDVAQAIADRLDLETQSLDEQALATQLGFLARFIGLDMPACSAATKQLLGWTATGPTLLQDIEGGAYTC